MKKTACLIILAALTALWIAPAAAAEKKDSLQTIRKAVREGVEQAPSREPRFFKLLITDHRSKKETVRVTLPLSLVEAFVRAADNKHLRFREHGCDVDLGEILAELKKAGPLALIEVQDEHALLKVWIE